MYVRVYGATIWIVPGARSFEDNSYMKIFKFHATIGAVTEKEGNGARVRVFWNSEASRVNMKDEHLILAIWQKRTINRNNRCASNLFRDGRSVCVWMCVSLFQAYCDLRQLEKQHAREIKCDGPRGRYTWKIRFLLAFSNIMAFTTAGPHSAHIHIKKRAFIDFQLSLVYMFAGCIGCWCYVVLASYGLWVLGGSRGHLAWTVVESHI